MTLKIIEELRKNQKDYPEHVCSVPFCRKQIDIPNDINFCEACLTDLRTIFPLRHDLFDYSKEKPRFKISQKEAIEMLLTVNCRSPNSSYLHMYLEGIIENNSKPQNKKNRGV